MLQCRSALHRRGPVTGPRSLQPSSLSPSSLFPPLPLLQLKTDPYASSDSFWQTVVDNLPTSTGKDGAKELSSPETLNLTALLVSGGGGSREARGAGLRVNGVGLSITVQIVGSQ